MFLGPDMVHLTVRVIIKTRNVEGVHVWIIKWLQVNSERQKPL